MPVVLAPLVPPALAALGKAVAFVGSALGFAAGATYLMNKPPSAAKQTDAGGGATNAVHEMSKAEEGAAAKSETTSVADACSDCPPPQSKCKDTVKRMNEKNKKFSKELKEYSPETDAHGGHTFMAGGVLRKTVPGGHYKEIRDLQRGLKNELKIYAKNKCYETADAEDKVTRKAAEQNVAEQIKVPPGFQFLPL